MFLFNIPTPHLLTSHNLRGNLDPGFYSRVVPFVSGLGRKKAVKSSRQKPGFTVPLHPIQPLNSDHLTRQSHAAGL